jgi:hypothetical protein
LSGDSEHYSTAIYKAQVLKGFKGVTNDDRLYFGPFIGYGVGFEYLAYSGDPTPRRDPSRVLRRQV